MGSMWVVNKLTFSKRLSPQGISIAQKYHNVCSLFGFGNEKYVWIFFAREESFNRTLNFSLRLECPAPTTGLMALL